MIIIISLLPSFSFSLNKWKGYLELLYSNLSPAEKLTAASLTVVSSFCQTLPMTKGSPPPKIVGSKLGQFTRLPFLLLLSQKLGPCQLGGFP